jgi:transcriptional regulator of met regulon
MRHECLNNGNDMWCHILSFLILYLKQTTKAQCLCPVILHASTCTSLNMDEDILSNAQVVKVFKILLRILKLKMINIFI